MLGQEIQATRGGGRRELRRHEDGPERVYYRAEARGDLHRRNEDTRRAGGSIERDKKLGDHARASVSGPSGACASPSAAGIFAKNKNITGTRKSDRIVEDVSPPTTARARGWLASE